MVFKIKVTFDTPIAILDSEKLPLHERVVIVLVLLQKMMGLLKIL